MRRSVIVLSVFALALTLCLGGCNQNQGMPKAGEPGQPYPEDGYGGYSNANPNLIMNPGYMNYKNEKKLVKRALSQLGIKGANIQFRGGTLDVTIKVPKNLTTEEIEQLKWEAYEALRYELPRYQIELRSQF